MVTGASVRILSLRASGKVELPDNTDIKSM